MKPIDRKVLAFVATVAALATISVLYVKLEKTRQLLTQARDSLFLANRNLDRRDSDLAHAKSWADDREAEVQSMRNAMAKAGDDLDRAQKDIDLSAKTMAAAKRQLDSDRDVMNEQNQAIATLMDAVVRARAKHPLSNPARFDHERGELEVTLTAQEVVDAIQNFYGGAGIEATLKWHGETVEGREAKAGQPLDFVWKSSMDDGKPAFTLLLKE